MRILLASFKYFRDGRFIEDDFVLEKGKLLGKGKEKESCDLTYDSGYIIPPVFDSHIHGGWGIDFASEESFFLLDEKLQKQGIAYALPTLHNYKWPELDRIAGNFKRFKEKSGSDCFPFLRIEGPFLNREMCGAQDEKYILNISQKEVDRLLRFKDEVRMFTFAPELPGSEELAVVALKEGMIPSAGHSAATMRDFLPVYRAGVRHFTHFGNRMGSFHHREIGLIGAGLKCDDVFLEIIGDGGHVAYDFLDLVLKMKPANRVALVSDAIKQGFREDEDLKKEGFFRENSVIKQSQETIAGGETLLFKQIKKMIAVLDIDLEKLITMITVNPLSYFNISYNREKVTILSKDFDFLAFGDPAGGQTFKKV